MKDSEYHTNLFNKINTWLFLHQNQHFQMNTQKLFLYSVLLLNRQIEQITSEINEVKTVAEKNDEFIRKISDFIK